MSLVAWFPNSKFEALMVVYGQEFGLARCSGPVAI